MVLKDAPILILDEATSALDSEVELAGNPGAAARPDAPEDGDRDRAPLFNIARMDRLIVLEPGRIVEAGTHDALLRLGGHYERLWRHQSGGFLAHDIAPTETETELPEEPPLDELRAETKPEPSVDDAPVVTRA